MTDWRRSDLDVLQIICRECAMDPLHIVAVLHFESSFSPRAMNAKSSATGLIQWMAPYPGGHTREKFAALGVVGQLPILRDRFAQYKGRIGTLGRVYAVVACPAALSLRLGDDDPIYAAAESAFTKRVPWQSSAVRAYRANPGWDPLGSGVVTLRSLGYAARAKWGRAASEFYERMTGAKSPWRQVDDELPSLGYSLDKSGVRAFQQAMGLKVDGELGPMTRGAIAAQIAQREGWG
jgi:Putative peptidoglycan binding domain